MTATAAVNPYKAAAQTAKASKLACFLLANGISAKLARLMDGCQWRQVAESAGVNPPSWETQGMVIQQLRDATGKEVRNTQ